jgi:transcriptional/translational regulatory protein YebC/TACO1
MGELGSVSWQFERKAYFAVPASELDYDKAFELAIEAGADDVHEEEDMIEIVGPVESFKAIADLLHKAKVNPEDAGLRMVPKQEMELDVNDALQVLKVIESLEEMDDVQNVYSNLKMSEEALAALEAE